MKIEDPRKIGLKKGLRQLTISQLKKVLTYKDEMVLDDCNYKNGKFCPLAVAVGLETLKDPSDKRVIQILQSMGYKIYNTRGIKGKFYTTNRKEDLISTVKEVLAEKQNV